MLNKPDKIITHTAQSSTSHTAQDVDQWHRDRWNGYNPSPFHKNNKGIPYVAGYHIIIEWDGKIVQCRDFTEEGVHCYGQNFTSIGICFMGNGNIHLPSEEQKESWKLIYQQIQTKYPQITPSRIYPHRKYANKTCHGRLLSDEYFALILGQPRSPSINELMERLRQLQNQLKSLLTNRRLK